MQLIVTLPLSSFFIVVLFIVIFTQFKYSYFLYLLMESPMTVVQLTVNCYFNLLTGSGMFLSGL
jgi:hypothetical protein